MACIIEGCHKEMFAKKLCRTHYDHSRTVNGIDGVPDPHRQMIKAARDRMMALLERFPSQWLLYDDVMCAGFLVELDDPAIDKWRRMFIGAIDRMQRRTRDEGIYKMSVAKGMVRIDKCRAKPAPITRRPHKPLVYDNPSAKPAFIGIGRFYPGSQPRYSR